MVQNPLGVRVALPSPDFITNLEALGAYVGLGDADMLRLYFFKALRHDNPEAHAVFQTFADEKRNDFGMTRPLASWKRVLATACDRDNPLTFLDIPLPLPTTVRTDQRDLYTYISSMHQLMQKDPDRFAGENHTNPDLECYINRGFDDECIDHSAHINGHLPEDWNRAYWLLKAYERCIRNVRHILSHVAVVTILPSITSSNALRRHNALKKLTAEEELYRVNVVKWENIAGVSDGADPSSLLSPDGMRGIIAWLQTSLRARQLEEEGLAAGEGSMGG